MTTQEALYALGVRDDTLTPQEKDSLARLGYVFLHNLVPPETARRMLAAMHEVFAIEKPNTPENPKDVGQLQNKSDAFDICVTHPRALAAVHHVLGAEMVSLGVHSRPNPPGKGRQGLHQDGEHSCNSIWPLADFTVENGATRVVPGSHLLGKTPAQAGFDPDKPHPDEVCLVAPVGTVVVFNGHTWHSAMPNLSRADRPNVTSFWGLRTAKYFDAALSAAAKARLSPAAQSLFPSPE